MSKRIITLTFMLFISFLLVSAIPVYAGSGDIYDLDETIDNEIDVNLVEELHVTSSRNLDKIKNFPNIKNITVRNTYIADASYFNLDYQYSTLTFTYSVVNIANLKKDSFRVFSNDAFFISNKPTDYEVKGDILNSDWEREEKYDDRFTEIAKGIYKEGMTDLDVIKAVTLYVVKHMEYKVDAIGNTQAERVLNGNGVCGDYSYFEAQLLNKLGIFATPVGGYTNPNNPSMSTHQWVAVYLNDKFYYIDPTWLDLPSIEDATDDKIDDILKSSNCYMVDDSNELFMNKHIFTFDLSLIPIDNLKSKMSILVNDENNESSDSNSEKMDSNNSQIVQVEDTAKDCLPLWWLGGFLSILGVGVIYNITVKNN